MIVFYSILLLFPCAFTLVLQKFCPEFEIFDAQEMECVSGNVTIHQLIDLPKKVEFVVTTLECAEYVEISPDSDPSFEFTIAEDGSLNVPIRGWQSKSEHFVLEINFEQGQYQRKVTFCLEYLIQLPLSTVRSGTVRKCCGLTEMVLTSSSVSSVCLTRPSVFRNKFDSFISDRSVIVRFCEEGRVVNEHDEFKMLNDGSVLASNGTVLLDLTQYCLDDIVGGIWGDRLYPNLAVLQCQVKGFDTELSIDIETLTETNTNVTCDVSQESIEDVVVTSQESVKDVDVVPPEWVTDVGVVSPESVTDVGVVSPESVTDFDVVYQESIRNVEAIFQESIDDVASQTSVKDFDVVSHESRKAVQVFQSIDVPVCCESDKLIDAMGHCTTSDFPFALRKQITSWLGNKANIIANDGNNEYRLKMTQLVHFPIICEKNRSSIFEHHFEHGLLEQTLHLSVIHNLTVLNVIIAPPGCQKIGSKIQIKSFCIAPTLTNIDPDRPYGMFFYYCEEEGSAVKEVNLIYPVLMFISSLCLVLAIAVYVIAPAQVQVNTVVFSSATRARSRGSPRLINTLFGKLLVSHMGCLMLGFLSLGLVQAGAVKAGQPSCTFMALSVYFNFTGAFAWLSVLCFDLWWQFREVQASNDKRIIPYSICGFGLPIIMTSFALAAEIWEFLPCDATPHFNFKGCWFSGNLAQLIFFYGPISILVGLNVILFTLMLINLKIFGCFGQNRAPSIGASSNRSSQIINTKFWLASKLFIIMGIPWIIEIIAWAPIFRPESNHSTQFQVQWYWYLMNTLNASRGVMVLTIFVLTKKHIRVFFISKLRIFWKSIFPGEYGSGGRQKNDCRAVFAVESNETTRSTRCESSQYSRVVIETPAAERLPSDVDSASHEDQMYSILSTQESWLAEYSETDFAEPGATSNMAPGVGTDFQENFERGDFKDEIELSDKELKGKNGSQRSRVRSQLSESRTPDSLGSSILKSDNHVDTHL